MPLKMRYYDFHFIIVKELKHRKANEKQINVCK